MKKYAYFKNQIVELEKICISPYNIGFLRGYGVFDVMCTQNGKPFLLDEHWERLVNSASLLDLSLPLSKEDFQMVVLELLQKNGFQKSTIRTVLSGGESSDGFSFEPGKETFLILIEEFRTFPAEAHENGVKVITLDFERVFPSAKTTNYATAIKNQAKKKAAGALEIIYVKNGIALEAATSNFCIVKDGKIISPKDNVLPGITRLLALRLARENGIQVEEKSVSLDEFLKADEIFLTASNKDIVPVVRVDEQMVSNGKPGEVTGKIMKLFSEFVKNY